MAVRRDSLSLTKVFQREDLEVFNVLKNPVWVLDAEFKCMYWGNDAALAVWSASTLQELIDRDFATDMSPATESRLEDYLARFRQGEVISEQWTVYPNFGKEGPKTINCVHSGIWIDNNRLAVLVEAVFIPESGRPSEEVDQMGVRGVEMLRQLPVVVRQFDVNGNIMDQNAEAMKEFGPAKTNRKPNEPCDFIRSFESEELGAKMYKQIQETQDCKLDAEQSCMDGKKWFSIRLRRVRDPVTNSDVIVYSGRDISDIMERAKEEADRISMERSEFFAVMAHEIRTPLHQINGFIELLARTSLTEEQKDFITVVQGSTSALMAIINDLLDFTKIEAGKLALENIPFEARGVVNGCIAAIMPQADDKKLQVVAHIARQVPLKLQGDPNRLRQIMSNLLSNAVKFTKEGTISTKVTRLDNDAEGRVVVRIEVSDTGIGIKNVESKTIFNAYQQADASTSRHFGGTGLGLAICDALVKAMGGRIGVESEYGKGSTFWFELPFQRYLKRFSGNELSNENEVEDKRCLRILMAEDNKVNQKLASAMLKRLGHTVHVVENGEMAVSEIDLRRQDYDVVLMDIQMPVMDGIDAAKEIRNHGFSFHDLPVLGLTASVQSIDWHEVGMNDCIKKPVRMNDLKQALAKNVPCNKSNGVPAC
eukprot:scaffold1192_cov58-Cylindrotheca_fusiformis.AAC.5